MILWIYISEVDMDKVKTIWPALGALRNVCVDTAVPYSREIHVIDVYCRLYELSGRLIIPRLQSLVQEMIISEFNEQLAAKPFRSNKIIAILNHIYTHTAADDIGLRAELTIACVRQLALIENQQDVVDVIKEHDKYGWHIAKSARQTVIWTGRNADGW